MSQADRSQSCNSLDFQYSRFSFFYIRYITPAVSHSYIEPASINFLNILAICLRVAVSCLSQKSGIWSLPGVFQFSVVLSAFAMSYSHIGLHSMLGLCCHWSFIQHASLLCETFSPYISLQKFSTSFCQVRFSRWGLAALNGYNVSYSLF